MHRKPLKSPFTFSGSQIPPLLKANPRDSRTCTHDLPRDWRRQARRKGMNRDTRWKTLAILRRKRSVEMNRGGFLPERSPAFILPCLSDELKFKTKLRVSPGLVSRKLGGARRAETREKWPSGRAGKAGRIPSRASVRPARGRTARGTGRPETERGFPSGLLLERRRE
jgi:hypothetical protein